MKERLLVFHGTSPEAIEKIVDYGAIRVSGGRYGTGIYCTNSFKKAYEHSCGAIIGIYPKGLEKHARVPVNKLKKWVVFDEMIPLRHVKYVVILGNENHSGKDSSRFIQLENICKECNLTYLYCETITFDEIVLQKKMQDITNFLYSDASKRLPYKVQWDKMNVCKEYSIDCVIGTIKSILDSKKN